MLTPILADPSAELKVNPSVLSQSQLATLGQTWRVPLSISVLACPLFLPSLSLSSVIAWLTMSWLTHCPGHQGIAPCLTWQQEAAQVPLLSLT